MATKNDRYESFKKAFLINAIPFLKEINLKCKSGYNSIDVKITSERHKISSMAVPVMVDLQILSCSGAKKQAKLYWKTSETDLTTIAERIYDRMLQKTRATKAAKKDGTPENLNKKLVKVLGTKRVPLVKNQMRTLILRAMSAVHACTKDGHLVSYDVIYEEIQTEIENETMSKRIIKALIDGNYIKEKYNNKIFTWVEKEPDEEHATFIMEMIQEEITPVGRGREDIRATRVNKIFEFLMFLSTLKVHTPLKMRDKTKEYKLSLNDQVVLTEEVLDHTGGKINRKYKWKLSEVPSLQMAERIYEKCLKYGSKYQATYIGKQAAKQTNSINTGAKPGLVDMARDFLKKNLEVKPVARQIVSSVQNPQQIIKNVVDSLIKEKEIVLVEYLKLENRIKQLNVEIEEGQALISLKEKEAEFISKYAVNPAKPEQKPTVVVQLGKRNNRKHNHTKKAALELFEKKPVLTLAEISEHFYPGQNLNWETNEIKSLNSMIYYMKKENLITATSPGVYRLLPITR